MIWTGSGWKSDTANMSPRDALKSGESKELPRVAWQPLQSACAYRGGICILQPRVAWQPVHSVRGNLCRGGFSSWHNLQFVPSLRNYSKTEKKQQFLRQIENTSCHLASLRNSPRDLLADDDTNSILSDGVKIVGEVIVVI